MQITGKASIKSDIDKIAFIQNHPNGQKMIKCKPVQTTLFQSSYQTILTFTELLPSSSKHF